MFDFNSPLLGLIFRLIGIAGFAFVFILQLQANTTPTDKFTPTRMLLTLFISVIIITASPSIAYLFIRALGGESEVVRQIATIAGNFGFAASAMLDVVIYLLKIPKDSKDK